MISTAESSGESNDTAAAEWITVSQLAKIARSASFEAEAVAGDVAGDRGDPTRDAGEVDVGVLAGGAQSVEGVVLEDLAVGAAGGARALAVADQQHQLAVGDRAQEPLDQRRADETGGAGDGDPFARKLFGDHS